MTTGDLDGDGNKEIYAFIWDLFTMRIWECTGDMQYTEVFGVDQLYSTEGIDYGALDAVRVADVNNDGQPEMYIAGTEDPNTIFIVTGVTDVSQMSVGQHQGALHHTDPVDRGGFRSMQIADPDKDGNAEPHDRRRTRRDESFHSNTREWATQPTQPAGTFRSSSISGITAASRSATRFPEPAPLLRLPGR